MVAAVFTRYLKGNADEAELSEVLGSAFQYVTGDEYSESEAEPEPEDSGSGSDSTQEKSDEAVEESNSGEESRAARSRRHIPKLRSLRNSLWHGLRLTKKRWTSTTSSRTSSRTRRRNKRCHARRE